MTIFFNTGLRFNGEKDTFCTHIPSGNSKCQRHLHRKVKFTKEKLLCFYTEAWLGCYTLGLFNNVYNQYLSLSFFVALAKRKNMTWIKQCSCLKSKRE